MATAAPPRPSAELTDAIALVHAALDQVAAASAGVEAAGVFDALDATREVERLARRVRSVQLSVVDALDSSEVYRNDGHRSVKGMVAVAARTSDAEALRREKATRALRRLPTVAAALRDGRIGACQVDRIARAWANPRTQGRFERLDDQIADLAARLTYDELDRRLTNWTAEADEDGTADRSSANHENRDARLIQDFDGGWRGLVRCGSLDGAEMHAIKSAFIEAELAADWAEARALHGDDATSAHLVRTDAQRRADAELRLHRVAAANGAAQGVIPAVDTNVVIDRETFERHASRIAGEPQPARTPDLDPTPQRATRCETTDGYRIDPTEAVANALVGHVRRVVIDARSVVIDLSRRQRLFTGSATLAAVLPHHRCYWPGCTTPASRCQTDHLQPWNNGGRTSPDNGAPACGHHNRWKEHGYTVQRDEHGRLHVHRPDGTPIN